ncbi:hypothetical protein AMATHDRAFT_77032 [Amanita thiersii Skay4041]|uniref:Peptidase S54 rhomboid domain-containing protein n=1 Tax=Amanita thiersii Skay4041 TaxID=703135 RepID=A0A2A9NB11_9AGAR|nr:hypothetical protein AMATHDRAFT_77032 [Amanita thiersii Skay4041]
MSFEHALVTKGIMVGGALSSILVGLLDVKHYFHLQLIPHMSRHHQYWRLFVHHLAFSNSTDLFLCELLLFNVGIQVERQFGSIKYASFAVISLLLATILEFVFLLLFHRLGLNHIAMGPSTLIFSILYQYSRIVPTAYKFRIFGVPLSNKSMQYLLGLQLAVSRLPASVAVAIIGIVVGQLYRSDLANLKLYRLPPFIISLASQFVQPLLGNIRSPHRSSRAMPDESRTHVNLPSAWPPQNEEVVTTARAPPATSTVPGTPSNTDTPGGARGPSVVRQWVDELSGRAERENAGIRVPTEEQINTMTAVFPQIPREIIVNALQEK